MTAIFRWRVVRFRAYCPQFDTRLDCVLMDEPIVSARPEPSAPADPAAEQIARAIERDIFRGRLRPGEKLREEDLAERFGASRHHIREALLRLSRVGIIVKERNRGASVRQFTADELRQIYEVREILQRQAALRIKLPADSAAIATAQAARRGLRARGRGRGLPADPRDERPLPHGAVRALQQPAARLPHQPLHGSHLRGARRRIRGPREHRQVARPPPHHDPTPLAHGLMGARADLRRPHPAHQGSISRGTASKGLSSSGARSTPAP